jgi:hypothetical protein
LGVDILDHEITEKTRSLGIAAPGLGAWNTLSHDGSIWDAASTEDATLARLGVLCDSQNRTEYVANAANLGIDLYNTSNSLMRGIGNGNLGSELMSRYGLGGEGGFAPTLTLSMTETKTQTRYQTQGMGGIDRGGNVTLEAGEGVDLENGVRVHAGGNLQIDAPEVIARAAALHSSSRQEVKSISASFVPTGQIQDVSISYSKTENKSVNYVNAELSAAGNMKLHYQGGAMSKLELDGANIVAQTLDANIKELRISDKQDTSVTKTCSASASVSGQVSAYKGKGSSKITQQNSGIHVVEGFNTKEHAVHIEQAYMRGGKITTDGENHFTADKLVTETVKDEQSYKGQGISFNVNDLKRLKGEKATNAVGEKAIATATFSLDKVNYQAKQTSVVYGAKGTDVHVRDQQGALHTSDGNGKTVLSNKEMHLQLDLPLTNRDYLEKSKENFQAGATRLVSFFKPARADNEALAQQKESDYLEEEKIRVQEEDVQSEDPVMVDQDNPDAEKEVPEQEEQSLDQQEIFIDPKKMDTLMKEAFEHLTFTSKEEEAAFSQLLTDANHQFQQTGELSPKTQRQLSDRLKSVLLDTVKTAGETGWSQLITHLASAPIAVKAYMVKNSVLFTFAFNLANGESKQSAAGMAHDALSSTVGDYCVALLPGPVGWTLFGVGISDTLLYDAEHVKHYSKKGGEYINEAMKAQHEGKWMKAWELERIAGDNFRIAGQMQAFHTMAQSFKMVGEAIVSRFWRKPPSVQSAAVPTHQPPERVGL